MNKVPVLDLEGKVAGEVSLPEAFTTEINPRLIKKAVLHLQSHRWQKKGAMSGAGRLYVVEYEASRSKPAGWRIINMEVARLPRSKEKGMLISGRAIGRPREVGGPKAFAPTSQKNLWKKINKKELRKAKLSAIAATGNKFFVKKRGHKFDEKLHFPIVVVPEIEELKKTKDIKLVLEKLGLGKDLERVAKRKQERAGKGKKRGRRYKKAKSMLLVFGEKGEALKAAQNLEGVDSVLAKDLNVELLAPGTHPGRLVVWSKRALDYLNSLYGKPEESTEKKEIAKSKVAMKTSTKKTK
jgi:large subunit ribosomal protein L4e